MTGKQIKSQSRHIVDVLGGRTAASEITGEALTVIDSWLRTGWVHGKYHLTILHKGRAAGVNINPLDFVCHLWAVPPLDDGDSEHRAR
jgi:hypothetical protein